MVTEYVASRKNNILSMIHEEIAYISNEAWQRLVSTFSEFTVLAAHGRHPRNFKVCSSAPVGQGCEDAAVNLLQTISTEAFGAEMVAAQGVLRQNCEACPGKAEPFREMSKSMWHLLGGSTGC